MLIITSINELYYCTYLTIYLHIPLSLEKKGKKKTKREKKKEKADCCYFIKLEPIMAKGFKLKELLRNEKEKQKLEKLKEAKKVKNEEESKKDEVTVVDHSTLLEREQEKLQEDTNVEPTVKEDSKGEEYKSEALSKKEKRKLKKQQKKEKIVKAEEQSEKTETIEKEEEEEEEETRTLDLNKLQESESESEDDNEEESDKQDDEEEEEAVPLSEVEFDSDADVVPHSKLTINNIKAIKHCLERVSLPWSKHSFEEHQSIVSKENTDSTIKDIYDDTERELAFYKQSLDAVNESYEILNKKLKIPFIRPLDYFAEMVKSDEHMDKIKSKLITEVSERKAREEARRQRQLKKFGKQVQIATLQKRQLEKKEALDKIKSLKKKRKQNEISGEDFDVEIEDEFGGSGSNGNKDRWTLHKPSAKRAAKNNKYGKGGLKRFKRKNDAESSADITGFSHKKMKGSGGNRPGKSRRQRRY